MTVRVNGRALEDYKRFDVRETGLAVPEAEPLYQPVVTNGIPADKFIIDDYLSLYLPLYLLKGNNFKSVDRYHHTGTVTGALWGPQGRTLDGDDKITIGKNSALAQTNMSVAAWVYFDALTNAYNSVISFEQANTGHTLLVKSNGKLAVYLGNGAAFGVFYDGTGSETVLTGGWYYLAWSYDGNNLIGYVNGTQDKDQATAGTIATPTTQDFCIGDWYNTGRAVSGTIGEIWVYTRALTAAEFELNHLATIGRYQS